MVTKFVESRKQTFPDIFDRKILMAEHFRYKSRRAETLDTLSSNAVVAAVIETYVTRLKLAGAGRDAPQVGERMPPFLLPDDQGSLVSLDALLRRAPVLISFHRGHWCPHCRLNLFGLAEIQKDIAPAQIVAISAQTQHYTKIIKAESGAGFPFLTDFANGYALSLNLAVWVDDATSSLIAGAGWDVPSFQGVDGWILPIPSVFIVGQDGIIKARHIDTDYRQRLEPTELRDKLKQF